jgi:hypothetical protein
MSMPAPLGAAQNFLSRLAAADGGCEERMLQVSYFFKL